MIFFHLTFAAQNKNLSFSLKLYQAGNHVIEM